MRGVGEGRCSKRSFITYNGPDPSNADGILNDALDVYFKGGDVTFPKRR